MSVHLPRVPKKPKELVVLSWAGHWGHSLNEAISKPFSRLTGIPVRQRINIGLKLPEELDRSLASNKPAPVDVVWSNSVPALLAAKSGNCLSLDEIAHLEELTLRAKPDFSSDKLDGDPSSPTSQAWPVVLCYVVYYVLVYNQSVLAQAPGSWEELMDPSYRGRIALYPGGNGFYPIAQTLGGGKLSDIPKRMEPCWEYCHRLAPQLGQLDYSIGMEESIRRGDLHLCFRALTNALGFQKANVPVSWCVPKEGTADTLDALWIPKTVPEHVAYWSKRYIEFALSPSAQTHWCALLGTMPVNQNAQIPSLFLNSSALPCCSTDHHNILALPESIKMKYQPIWEEHFNQIIVVAKGK